MSTRICAAVTARTMPELKVMVKKAVGAQADLMEIRLDYLNDDYDLREIRNLTKMPIVATNRMSDEGGVFKGAEEKRLSTL
ncbi:MAG: 3-dehydroquinate dehydratase, partial [Thermoproteota archaeon]|nr:3-dehydroquinate dehydratase [Thermoproteota archaeon]